VTRSTILVLAAAVVAAASPSSAAHDPCTCDYAPPGGAVTMAGTLAALQSAINSAAGPTTILVSSGIYDLRTSPYAWQGIGIQVGNHDVTIRSATGNPEDVIFDGGGMSGGVAKAFMISDYTTGRDSLRNITIADVTIRNASNHLISVQGEFHARNLMLHNLHLVNAGQQLVKVNPASSSNPTPVTNGTIACCIVEYETYLVGGWYTQGIDIHGGDHWTIRGNTIRNIRADPSAGIIGGPAILVWSNSVGTVVERNRVIDCDRGIMFGDWSHNGFPYLDHTGGIIRGNTVKGYAGANPEGTAGSYESIALANAVEVVVGNNTMYAPGFTNRGIDLVGPATQANVILDNLTDKEITIRAGASGAANTFDGNIVHAGASNYVNAAGGDFHLAPGSAAIDFGVPYAEACADVDCEVVADGEPDAGADEVAGAPHPGGPCEGDATAVYDAPRTFRATAAPNPADASAAIVFTLPSAAEVTVEIHDLSGRLVRTVLAGVRVDAGRQRAIWDGKDGRGRPAASGVYLYRVRAGSRADGGKIVLLRR